MDKVSINEILPDEITKLDSTLCTLENPHSNTLSYRSLVQDVLAKTIDCLGEQSAQAQGLNKVITNAVKMRNSNHFLYLLKDAAARGGNGELIGYIKVGHKNLFLFDEDNKVYEVEPLCVLDFFVTPKYQRCGKGKLLFDYMLHDMNARVHDLAIDGPSMKMEHFIRKNYGIDRLIRQNNNFAIAPEFFANITGSSRSGRSTPREVQNIGRFAAPKPRSTIGKIIHGDNVFYDTGKGPSHLKPLQVKLFRNSTCSDEGVQTDLEEEVTHKPDEVSNGPAVDGDNEQNTRPSYLSVKPVHMAPPAPRAPHVPRAPPAPPSPRTTLAPLNISAPSSPYARSSTGRRSPHSPQHSTPAGMATPRNPADPTQLTKRGHFDVKFYHNKLW